MHSEKMIIIGLHESIWVDRPPPPPPHSTSSPSPVGVTDLQQRRPAVPGGSGRGAGCAGRGRSAPRGRPPPLGGALSPQRRYQEPRPRWAPTGHCADGPAWKDTHTHTHTKQINKSVRHSAVLLCTTPPSPLSNPFLCPPPHPPPSSCVFAFLLPGGDYCVRRSAAAWRQPWGEEAWRGAG